MFFWNSKKWIVLFVYFRWSNIGYSSWLVYPYIITILNNPSKLLTIKKYLTLYWYIIYYKCKYGQLSKYMQSFFLSEIELILRNGSKDRSWTYVQLWVVCMKTIYMCNEGCSWRHLWDEMANKQSIPLWADCTLLSTLL